MPDNLGRYRILGHLATGGMAEILLARLSGPSSFERPVVIKRILPHLSQSKTFVDMFLDEARITAGIRHPNVVQLHDLGCANGELFLVMEYIEGESLGAIMRRLWSRGGSVEPILAAHVVAEACAGLHAAHELEDRAGTKRHLVHRDVTPQNIMVTYAGQVKVLDFGIAKARDCAARTEAGQVRGKFEYMSPEQCRGEPLDRRSDVFGLGILLYELSVGTRLFKRSGDLLAMRAICDEPNPLPSVVRPGYPRCLEGICMRALAKRPDDRYPSAAEMRRDLVSAMAELGGSGLHDESLGQLIRALFPDRMQQKVEMLRRVCEASSTGVVPAAEDNGKIDASPLPVSSGREQRRVRPSVLTAGIGALLLGGIALWRLAPARERPRATPVAVATATARIAPPNASGSADPYVEIQVDTVPAGGKIVVDGRDYGITPAKVRLPRGSQPVAIGLSHDGFAPLKDEVVPNVDQRLVLQLQAMPSARTPRPRQSASDKAAELRRPVFQRFE
jgi:hypothetical protein